MHRLNTPGAVSYAKSLCNNGMYILPVVLPTPSVIYTVPDATLAEAASNIVSAEIKLVEVLYVTVSNLYRDVL